MVVESMNEPMRSIRAQAQPLIAAGALDESLSALLHAGFSVAGDGVFFTRELELNGHLRTAGLDLTGEEALINRLHLDDLVDTGKAGWAVDCLVQGVLLAGRVFEAVAALTSLPIDVVVSVDLGGRREGGDQVIESYPSSTFRFFGHREGIHGWQATWTGSLSRFCCCRPDDCSSAQRKPLAVSRTRTTVATAKAPWVSTAGGGKWSSAACRGT